MSGGDESDDERKSEGAGNRASVAAIIFVVLIVAGCVWLFEKLGRANDELNCVASGRRNCQQIDE
jgi:hypothetical protein